MKWRRGVGERDWEINLMSTDSHSNVYKSKIWERLKSGAKNFILVFHKINRNPSTMPSSTVFQSATRKNEIESWGTRTQTTTQMRCGCCKQQLSLLCCNSYLLKKITHVYWWHKKVIFIEYFFLTREKQWSK